ncbi:MAG: ribosomal-processing cysteine protease Prp [Mycoplasma sp.]
MIKIDFYKNGLVIKGHANFAESGKDIICSAVSAISQSALNWFDQSDIYYEINDGHLELIINNQSDKNLYLLDLIKIQLNSFDDEAHAKYIKIINHNNKEVKNENNINKN